MKRRRSRETTTPPEPGFTHWLVDELPSSGSETPPPAPKALLPRNDRNWRSSRIYCCAICRHASGDETEFRVVDGVRICEGGSVWTTAGHKTRTDQPLDNATPHDPNGGIYR